MNPVCEHEPCGRGDRPLRYIDGMLLCDIHAKRHGRGCLVRREDCEVCDQELSQNGLQPRTKHPHDCRPAPAPKLCRWCPAELVNGAGYCAKCAGITESLTGNHSGLADSAKTIVRMALLLRCGCWSCGRSQDSTGQAERLQLDHDHRYGFVRGITCNGCNSAAGRFYDRPQLLRAAAAYLRGPTAARGEFRHRRQNDDPKALLLLRQGGSCAVCREQNNLCVDHEASTGWVRGVLCGPCNLGVGHIRHDPCRAEMVANYLERCAELIHAVGYTDIELAKLEAQGRYRFANGIVRGMDAYVEARWQLHAELFESVKLAYTPAQTMRNWQAMASELLRGTARRGIGAIDPDRVFRLPQVAI